VFVEEIRAENMELRRKDMILRSIPDHIVAFDSTGCVFFVSQLFNRALDFSSDELENTSFWDLLTEDSVRVMKSAFVNALAVKRKPEDDTTPLADGESISVRIIDKYGSKEKEGLPFSLKGVVHFAADSPECICTLCPEPTSSKSDLVIDNAKTKQVSDGSDHVSDESED
jgi:PAS domain S-box-containing protein